MKNIFLMVMILPLLIKCNLKNAALEGVYTRETHDKQGSLYDTLFIKMINAKSENFFSVIKSSSAVIIYPDGKKEPPVHKIKKWSAVFDPANSRLNIQDNGDSYFFDSRNGTLSNGKIIFTKKINIAGRIIL